MNTGLKKLDERYSQIFSCSSQLPHCADNSVPELYRTVLIQLEQVFALEQSLMEQSGFPATQCHLEQHARALRALHRLHPSVMRGDYAKARAVGGQLLADWLSLHIETQDATLVLWLTNTQPSAMAQLIKMRSEMHSNHANDSGQFTKFCDYMHQHPYLHRRFCADNQSSTVGPTS